MEKRWPVFVFRIGTGGYALGETWGTHFGRLQEKERESVLAWRLTNQSGGAEQQEGTANNDEGKKKKRKKILLATALAQAGAAARER